MVVFKIMVTLPLVFTFMTQITVVDNIIMSYMSFICFIYLKNSIFSVWTLSIYQSLSYENVPLIRQLNKFYFSVFPLLSFSSLNTSTAPKFLSIQQLCISSIFSMFLSLSLCVTVALCLQSLNTVHVVISSPDHCLALPFSLHASFLHSVLTIMCSGKHQGSF